MPRYNAFYPKGSQAKVASLAILEEFQRTWKYHDPIQSEQFAYADHAGVIKEIGYYHGGDVLYWFKEIPGTWHECCLVPPTNT